MQSVADSIGTTWCLLIKVSLFQRLFCTLLYVAETIGSVLIREMSLFRRSLIENFHCNSKSVRTRVDGSYGRTSLNYTVDRDIFAGKVFRVLNFHFV